MVVLGGFNFHMEAVSGAPALDFMVSKTTIVLSQYVIGPTHEAGHTLNLVFPSSCETGSLKGEGLQVTTLSWSDHTMVRFELMALLPSCMGGSPIQMIHLRRLRTGGVNL